MFDKKRREVLFEWTCCTMYSTTATDLKLHCILVYPQPATTTEMETRLFVYTLSEKVIWKREGREGGTEGVDNEIRTLLQA